MGALDEAALHEECKALAALAALCHVAPPSSLPSNWLMAERLGRKSNLDALRPAKIRKVLARAERRAEMGDGDVALRELAPRTG